VSGQQPSKLLNVSQWASDLIGMPDYITAIALDGAVMRFGTHVENKLMERSDDPPYRPLYTLEELLNIQPSLDEELRRNSEMFAAFRSALGGNTTIRPGTMILH